MRESRVITEIWWELSQGFDPRAALVLSDDAKIRLDAVDFKVKLKLDTDFEYPLDADLSARSRTYEPQAVRVLEMIQVLSTTPTGTSVGLRLFDGTDERFWGGASWDVAGLGDWNTEAEINANIGSFDVSAKKFAIVLNLVTTDEKVTPTVEAVLVLWKGPIDWNQDVTLDSLLALFQDELTYIEDLALPPLAATSATIDLDDYTDESELDFVGADAVFDEDADPGHVTDLLSSYDAGTRVLTLSTAIPVGNRPFLRMIVRPNVAWDTHQDFGELGKLPEIVLRDTSAVRSSPYPFRSDTGIVRKDTGAGVSIPAPYRTTYEVTMEVRLDRSTTQMRLIDELIRIFVDGPASEIGPFLRSRATDRRYRLRLIDEFRAADPRVNLADVRSFVAEFRIEDVALQLSAARDVFAVQSLNLGFANVPSESEQEAIAAEAPIPSTPPETVVVN